MERMRSIFGTLLRRSSSFIHRKSDIEKEQRKQEQVWNEYVLPTLRIFEGSDIKSWSNVPVDELTPKAGNKGIKSLDELAEAVVNGQEIDFDTIFLVKKTPWTPEIKLKEYLKHKAQIEDVTAKINTVFHSVGNPNPVKRIDQDWEDELHESATPERLKLKELCAMLVKTQEDIYKALVSRYPLLHKLKNSPDRVAIFHYAKTYPSLYRQGGSIANEIRARLWETSSLTAFDKFRFEKQIPAYYQFLLAPEMAMESPKRKLVFEQIGKDIHRTLADERYFQKEANCEKLRNVLKAFAVHHPKIGYCQSMNFVAGGILMMVDNEETAFYIFSRLIIDIMPPDYYSLSMSGVVTDVQVLTKLLKMHLPAIYSLLSKLEVKLEILCCHMLMSLCFGAAPLSIAQRCMDLVLLEGSHVLVCIVLAMIMVCREQILAQDDAGDMMLLLAGIGRDLDEEDYSELFACVYHFVETAGDQIIRMRSALADQVRKEQEKLLEKCFIQLNDGAEETPRHRPSISAPTTPHLMKKDGDLQSEFKRSSSLIQQDEKNFQVQKVKKSENVDRVTKRPKLPPTGREKKLNSKGSQASTGNLPTVSESKKNMRPNLPKGPMPSWLRRDNPAVNMQKLQVLVGMGFSMKAAKRACLATKGQDVQATLNWLLTHVTEAQSAAVDDGKASGESTPIGSQTPSLLTDSGKNTPAEERSTRSDGRHEKRRQKLRVSVPPGVAPGQLIQVRTPYGRLLRVRVPRGLGPGSQFLIEISNPKGKKRKSSRRKGVDRKEKPSNRRKSSKKYLRFTVPEGLKPGQLITVATPEGNRMQLKLPPGAFPGKQLRVEYTLQRTSRSSSHRQRGARRKGSNFGLEGNWMTRELECLEKPFGMTIQDGTVIVTRVKGVAKTLGVLAGDRVVSIAGVPVDPVSWRTVYQAAKPPFSIVIRTPARRIKGVQTMSSLDSNPSTLSRHITQEMRYSSSNRDAIMVCVIPFGISCEARNGLVVVKSSTGEALRSGIKPGDILESVSGYPVTPANWMDYFRSACLNLPFEINILHSLTDALGPPGTPPLDSTKKNASYSTPASAAAATHSTRRTQHAGPPLDFLPSTENMQLNPNEDKTNNSNSAENTKPPDRPPPRLYIPQVSGTGPAASHNPSAERKSVCFSTGEPIGMELSESTTGLKVLSTIPGTQADGKIQVGWKLLSISGKDVTTRRELKEEMLVCKRDSTTVKITFLTHPVHPGTITNSSKEAVTNTGSKEARVDDKKPEPSTKPQNPKLSLKQKLALLRGMGFSDDRKMAAALASTDGDVDTACAMLLSG
ncbi:hypothetical protein AAMO2058_001400400 [Amorphochlora amoebiformis]